MELVGAPPEAQDNDDRPSRSTFPSIYKQFGDRFTVEEIDATIAELSKRFAGARIRTYIPILLHRDVQRELALRAARRARGDERPPGLAQPGAA